MGDKPSSVVGRDVPVFPALRAKQKIVKDTKEAKLGVR